MMRASLALALFLGSRAAAAAFPEVRMDARVELISAVALLAGGEKTGSGLYEYPIPYARRLRRELGPRRDHPAVATLDAGLRRGLTSLQLYEIAMRLSPYAPYDLRRKLPGPIIEKLGGPEGAAQFVGQLSLFASDADFAGFWERSEPERRALVESVELQARDPFIRETLEKYTGLPAPSYQLLISPEAEAVAAFTVKGYDSVLSIFGPDRSNKDREGRPIFRFDLVGRPADFWRESVEVQISNATGATGDEAREIAIATAARLLWLTRSREMGEESLVKYARIGMPHLRALFDRLAVYEVSRDSYPTLVDFYPELKRAYEQDDQVSDFSGVLEALWTTSDSATVVVPASAWSARVLKVWPNARVLDAAAALSSDLSGGHIIAVGSIEENAWIRERWKELRLPLELTRASVEWTRAERGVNDNRLNGRLGLITVARHPNDRMHGVLLVTAVEPGAVPALELPPSTGVDFLVLEGKRVVKAGLYEKTRLPWRMK